MPEHPSAKYDIKNADFRIFLKMWNQQQNMTTPQHHLDIVAWLEYAWERKDTRLLLMAFRSAGKSTIVGLFAAWLLYRNPDLRILVLAADQTLAGKMVRNVKRIIERHPLSKGMKPEKAEQWASERFTVKRMISQRDPSMLARGVTSNITGSRADVVICDDVEVPNTCDTPEKRRELRARLAEMEYVLVPGGTRLYVGTPHHYNTIYADEPRRESGEEKPFLNGFKRLKLPILDGEGQSAWIEKYSEKAIARMKRESGPSKFASQMMLEPRNIAEGRLNPKLIRIYDDALDYTKELQALFLGQTKLVSASAYWDPAFGSAKGDNSVLAIVYSDADGNHYLHHMEYIKIKNNCHPGASRDLTAHGQDSGLRRNDMVESDEATQQCAIVAKLAKAHHLPALILETNGIGKFLPTMLRNALANERTPCAVKEIHQSRNKDIRIIEGFDAALAARRLYVHQSVLQTPFMTEMREWRPGSNKGHDDGLDAAAGALAAEPDRLARLYGKGAQSWMRGQGAHTANTEFTV